MKNFNKAHELEGTVFEIFEKKIDEFELKVLDIL